jgi:hypothetical protein
MKRLVFFLFPLFFLLPHAQAQSTQNSCVQGACYGFGAPQGSCIGAFNYSDISQTPVQAYSCFNGGWVKSGGSGGTSGPSPIAGAMADFTFSEGSGTIVHDVSGNGNDATFTSGLNPTWNSNSLNFSVGQSVTLPSALNSSQTFILGLFLNNPLNLAMPFSPDPMLIGSSLGASGLNLLTAKATTNGLESNNGKLVPSIFAPNGITSAASLISGFHMLAYVLGTNGTSLDRIFLDGIEMSYNVQAASAGLQPSGNLFLGASNTGAFVGSGFSGTMYRFVTFASALTPTQIAQISTQIRGDVNSRGFFTSPQSIPQITSNINCIGDSITFGTGASTPFCSLLTSTPVFNPVNFGFGGITLEAIAGSEPNRVAPLCGLGSGAQAAIVFAGTNDLAQNNPPTFPMLMNYLFSEISTLKKAGCRVFVGTMLSRNGLDAQKDTYDALILSQAKTVGADGFIDFAADPVLGADGASTNTSWFNTDDTHPVQAGQNRMGVIASNSLNYYFGSNVASPNSTTAATYQMLSGDGYLQANPSASGQVVTLPDCMGPTGATYTVTNVSAFTSSVKGGTFNGLAETINFTALATAVSLPVNTSIVFRDVRNASLSAAGCHWEK